MSNILVHQVGCCRTFFVRITSFDKALTPTNSKGKQSTIVDQLRTSLKGKYTNSGVSEKECNKSRSRERGKSSDISRNMPPSHNSVRAYTNLPSNRAIKLNYNYR